MLAQLFFVLPGSLFAGYFGDKLIKYHNIIGTADVKFTLPDCWVGLDDPDCSSSSTSLEAYKLDQGKYSHYDMASSGSGEDLTLTSQGLPCLSCPTRNTEFF